MKMFDTIAAIATPVGVGGIAIIRVSGEDAVDIAQNVLTLKSGKRLCDIESRRLVLCTVYERGNKTPLDEALVSVMRAPGSYTGETVVEINCHGGHLVAQLVLDELIYAGARLAEAGEFTRRAFCNGKLDLTRAEAALDILNANSRLGVQNAAKAMSGKLETKINAVRNILLELASELSAAADYPDEVEEINKPLFEEKLQGVGNTISTLIKSFETGRILRDGIHTVIVGRPNVGKSSMLNALTHENRAIVTDIPGTTRDVIEEYLHVRGINLKLFDTAGIRPPGDEIERLGIKRSKKNIEIADLCLFVVDVSAGITDEDIAIANSLRKKSTIVLLNKADKTEYVDISKCAEKLGFSPEYVVVTSTPENGIIYGLDELEAMIERRFMTGEISPESIFITVERQKNVLISAQNALNRALESMTAGMPDDFLYVDLEEALSALGEITGKVVREEIIDAVFERFCVGK